MKALWILVVSAVGWALLVGIGWSSTARGAALIGSYLPHGSATLALALLPVVFGLYLALTLGRAPGPYLTLVQCVAAILYLALPYAGASPLLVRWGISAFAQPVIATEHGPETALVGTWLGVVLVQAWRPPIRRRRALPAHVPADALLEPAVLWSPPVHDASSAEEIERL